MALLKEVCRWGQTEVLDAQAIPSKLSLPGSYVSRREVSALLRVMFPAVILMVANSRKL